MSVKLGQFYYSQVVAEHRRTLQTRFGLIKCYSPVAKAVSCVKLTEETVYKSGLALALLLQKRISND